MTTLTIRKIGNSEGVILPKEILAKLNVKAGDKVFLIPTLNGFFLRSYDPDLVEDMEAADEIMQRYENVLRKLSES